MPHSSRLKTLFSPQSIAIIGASPHPGHPGNMLLENCIRAKFAGPLYLITSEKESILGLPTLCKVTDIPLANTSLDLAIICLPAEKVAACVSELTSISVKSILVTSSGFKETGSLGAQREKEIKTLAIQHNIALLGPNSFGLCNPYAQVNAIVGPQNVSAGHIGFFSQSGSLCSGVLDWATSREIGFSVFAGLGNKTTLDESDLLAYLADDPNTKVIAGYIESIEDGNRFMRTAQKITPQKPVVLLRAARTTQGARAASSHTGVLRSPDRVYEAAFKQAGIIRANSIEELLTISQAFTSQSLPQGSGVAIVSNAGGPGIIATDACCIAGLTLPMLTDDTIAKLHQCLPSYASFYNPVDTTSDISAETFGLAAKIVLDDPSVHTLLVLATPSTNAPVSLIAEQVACFAEPNDKPVFACLLGGASTAEGRDIFRKAQIPCYEFPDQAAVAIKAMMCQKQWIEYPLPVEVGYRRDVGKARAVIDAVKEAGNFELSEYQAFDIMRAYEMPVLKTKLARTSDEAAQIAKQMGYPVALKIASPHLIHKSDIGGVVLDLTSPESVRSAFLDITTRASRLRSDAYIAGCLVQAMAPKNSLEVIIGFTRDPSFGPVVRFSLGGHTHELSKDVACRLTPLALTDVHDMIREIRSFSILTGWAGLKPVNLTVIEDLLLIMSELALDFPEIQEAECTSVFVNEEGAIVGEMRVFLNRDMASAPGSNMLPRP